METVSNGELNEWMQETCNFAANSYCATGKCMKKDENGKFQFIGCIEKRLVDELRNLRIHKNSAQVEIDRLKQRMKEMEKEHRDDIRVAASGARYEEQGNEYGTY